MSTVPGDDDTFWVLLFTLVACIVFAVFSWPVGRFLSSLCAKDQYRREVAEQWARTRAAVSWGLANPGAVVLRGRILAADRAYCRRVVWPRVRFVFGLRALLLVLFFVLLTVVLYQRLTFDAHAILGVPRDAEEKGIKRAFRKLSLRYHPDKNKTEEAALLYPQVRKAYHSLMKPEEWEKELEEERRQAAQGGGQQSVALPRAFTDYGAPVMLILLCAVPVAAAVAMRRNSRRTRWPRLVLPLVKRIAEAHQLTDSMYELMGQPSAFERKYARQQRAALGALATRLEKAVRRTVKEPRAGVYVRMVPPKGPAQPTWGHIDDVSDKAVVVSFEDAPGGESGAKIGKRQIPRDVFDAAAKTYAEIELTHDSEGVLIQPGLDADISCADVWSLYGARGGDCPDGLQSTAQLRQLVSAAAGQQSGSPQGRTAGGSLTAQRTLVEQLYVSRAALPLLQSAMPAEKDGERERWEQYRRAVKAVESGKLAEPDLGMAQYAAPSDAAFAAGEYFVRTLHEEIREDQAHLAGIIGKHLAGKLLSVHEEKMKLLDSLRRTSGQADAARLLVALLKQDLLGDAAVHDLFKGAKLAIRQAQKQQGRPQ
eukprot:TRINITY_DN66103_c0_g1_i1.p1 TRINITY_DN66103_c0_g1~~TRINITY_DN66103_c0_g1_i1.p1  ORF type:complete len:596 (+),score=171.68 TRINITY_DN66103_c0_g1_i1:88-1875(+)